jgi:hypothetical protein
LPTPRYGFGTVTASGAVYVPAGVPVTGGSRQNDVLEILTLLFLGMAQERWEGREETASLWFVSAERKNITNQFLFPLLSCYEK